MARADQVRTGPATILSNIRGDQVEEFQVEITHVSRSGDGTRNLMLEVTDPKLLSATGGSSRVCPAPPSSRTDGWPGR